MVFIHTAFHCLYILYILRSRYHLLHVLKLNKYYILCFFLTRFAQFFLCPLFTASATDREVNAVDSENDKNLQSDSWRMFQLEKKTCNPKHDFGKFGTGLYDIKQEIDVWCIFCLLFNSYINEFVNKKILHVIM